MYHSIAYIIGRNELKINAYILNQNLAKKMLKYAFEVLILILQLEVGPDYFQNVMNYIKFVTQNTVKDIRNPFDKEQ